MENGGKAEMEKWNNVKMEKCKNERSVDDSESGEFEEELLGAGVVEADGGLGFVGSSFEFLDDADAEALMLDVGADMEVADGGDGGGCADGVGRRGYGPERGWRRDGCHSGRRTGRGFTRGLESGGGSRGLGGGGGSREATGLTPGQFHVVEGVEAAFATDGVVELQVLGVDVGDEAAGIAELHLAVAEAALGVGEEAVALGSGDGHVEQAALFFHLAQAAAGHLTGEEVLFESDDEDGIEFESFG